MRTTIDLPEGLYRELKTRAALEGVTMKDLVRSMVESGLCCSAPVARSTAERPNPPSLSIGHSLKGVRFSNAGLFELLDEQGCG
jgi:hypothetical protein